MPATWSIDGIQEHLNCHTQCHRHWRRWGGKGKTGSVCPGHSVGGGVAPNTAEFVQIKIRFMIHCLHSSLASLYDLRGLFCYVVVSREPEFLLSICAAGANFKLMHMCTCTWLLSSLLAKAPYLVLFDLKPLNEDDNLQVCTCMCRLDVRKWASRAHFIASKISWGHAPRSPLIQSILWAPLLVYALGLPNPLVALATPTVLKGAYSYSKTGRA